MRQAATNIKRIAIKCKFKMAKAEMGMRLKVGYAFFFFLLFNFFFALNFVQVFESNKTTRHTAKRGMPQAVYF